MVCPLNFQVSGVSDKFKILKVIYVVCKVDGDTGREWGAEVLHKTFLPFLCLSSHLDLILSWTCSQSLIQIGKMDCAILYNKVWKKCHFWHYLPLTLEQPVGTCVRSGGAIPVILKGLAAPWHFLQKRAQRSYTDTAQRETLGFPSEMVPFFQKELRNGGRAKESGQWEALYSLKTSNQKTPHSYLLHTNQRSRFLLGLKQNL